MEFVPLGYVYSAVEILRHAEDLELETRKGVDQPSFNQADGKVRNVDADPLAIELLHRMNCGPAAAEGIKDNIAFVGRRGDSPLKKRQRLLSWIAKTFLSLRIDRRDVCPDVAHDATARHFVQVSL